MSKKRILIVEDDLGIQALTKFCLEMDDSWEVSIVDNGKKSLSKAITFRPDVILLDWLLPDLSGTEILGRLSTNLYTAQIPIILFTAKLLNGETIESENSNVIGIINKPYNSLTLSADILHILSEPWQLVRDRNHRTTNH